MVRDMVAAVIVAGGRVLLVHNAKAGLRVEPPGGKVHRGEGFVEAVVREVAEELGVEVRVAGLLGEYGTRTPEGDFVVRMYLCEIIRGEPRVCEPEKVPGFGWYDAGEVEALARDGVLVPNMVEALEDIKGLLSGPSGGRES